MNVAVTGASGFIGRHVVTELKKRMINVAAVSRYPERLSTLPDGVRVIIMDINTVGDEAYDLLGRPDILIHLAWDGLPNYSSLHHYEQELPRQYAFLKGLIHRGLPTLFVAGTCFEYGLQSGPLSENVVPSPCNPYGHAKDALRRQLLFLQREMHFNFIWGRLFYLYGEGQACGSLYMLLRTAALNGDQKFNMSGGEQLRDYLHVEKAARMIINLALAERNLGMVNICSGEPVSVRSLIERWMQANGWNLILNFGYYPYPQHEPMAFWGDSTHLMNELAEQGSYV